MSASGCGDVLEALRNTPKGKLKYGSLLDKCSPKERLRLLEEWSSPPPLSPEAVKYLTERVYKLSVQNGTKKTKSETPSIASDNGEDLNVATTTTYVVEDTQHTPCSKYLLEVPDDGDDVTMATTYVAEPHFESVIDQAKREQQEYQQSLDDKLMDDLNQTVNIQREWFKGKIEQLRERNHLQYQQEKVERERVAWAMKEGQLEENRRIMQETKKRMEDITESYRLHEELLEAKLRSGEEQKLKIQKKIEEGRKMKQQKLLQQCREQIVEVAKMSEHAAAIFQSCSYPHFLPRSVVESYKGMHAIAREILSGLEALKTSGNPDEKSYDILTAKKSNYISKLVEISIAVNEANERGDREKREHEELLRKTAEKLEREQKAKEEEEKTRKEDAAKLAQQAAVKKNSGDGDGASSQSPRQTTGLIMPSSTLEAYDRLQGLLSKTVSSCMDLSSSKDPRIKKYRFDLQKAINIPMNSISASSGEDLLEKIVRLKKLFGGEPVTVMGSTLTIKDHPEAKFYCYNLFAKKLVKHGEDQVASNSEAAFPIAAVAIGLWSLFPDLGDLILAHFYTVCPILVPMYVEQSDGALPPELMKLQGFKVSSGGAVESEDVFLKRMRGVVRLYAAIVQTPQLPLGGQPRPPHPHSVVCGWTWMARMLNMEPHPTLTATALGDFLEVAGHAMMERFGRQFRKLLLVLCKEYIPKIEKVTPPSQKGPLSRLTLLLEDCTAAGRIPEPKGTLHEDFWRSRSHGVMIA